MNSNRFCIRCEKVCVHKKTVDRPMFYILQAYSECVVNGVPPHRIVLENNNYRLFHVKNNSDNNHVQRCNFLNVLCNYYASAHTILLTPVLLIIASIIFFYDKDQRTLATMILHGITV